VVRQLIAGLLADAPDATGLVMCSQMACLVFTDERGVPRSNVISWKDQRTLESHPSGAGSYFQVLHGRLTPEQHQRIGREVRVGVPITTLFWLAQRGQLVDDVYAVSLPDFVLASLCGARPRTEATNAAAHGLLDLERGAWDHDLITGLGLSSLRWPEVRPFGEVVGVVEMAGRLLKCHTPVGDYQCALAGAGLREGELSLNISTGSQVSLLSRTGRHPDCMVRPYFDGRWLHTLVQLPAGRALGLLIDLLTEIGRSQGGEQPDPWEYVERAVERTGTTDLAANLAFYSGPLGDRGSLTNIREDNLTVGHLFAAAFRAMAENYALCAQRVSPGRAWQSVVFSGGLAQRFERLRREILERLGTTEHRLCSAKEDTLLGLLVLARVCAGLAATVDEARTSG
jgi:sugar (pentulose or hexulose) kinase